MASTVYNPALSPLSAAGRGRSDGVSRERSINWLLIAQCTFLLVATCACYWPALNGAFQWDDGVLVKDNPLLRSAAGLRDIWFSTKPYDYFPLTYTTFWLEWPLWGDDPAGYHLVNLVLHLAGTGLLWRLLRVLRLPGAWFGALLFALHPVNVASVAWIAERKNTLSMVFFLACLLCYVRSEETSEQRTARRYYGWALTLFVLAALSKSSVVMLPLVLLLFCWWRRGNLTWNDLGRTLPFFVVSAACGGATLWFQYHRAILPGAHADLKMPLLIRVLMEAHTGWFYMGKAFLPIGLSAVYPRWTLGDSRLTDFLPALAWGFVLVTAWLGRARWGRGPLSVLLYFLVMLAPASGLLAMSFFSYSYVSDHLVQLPLLGLIVGVAAALGSCQERGGAASWLALTCMAAVVGACCILTPQRADQFSTPQKMWEAARLVDPGCYAVYNNLGEDAQAHRRLAQAEADFRQAVHLEPRSFTSCNNLANVFRLQGKWLPAAALYEDILRMEPNAKCYNNLAVVYLELGDTARARKQLQRAVALEPNMSSAYFNLFKLESAEHNLPAAADALRGCLRCDPFDAVALTCLATLSMEHVSANASDAAVPPDPVVFEPAVALAERAVTITQGRDPRCLEAYARTLDAAGHRAQAALQAQRATRAARDLQQGDLAAECAAYATSLAP